MVSIQASVSKGWLYKEGGFSFEEKYYLDPLYRWKQDREIDNFLKDRFPEYALYNMESNLVQAEFFKSDQVLVGAIQPNLIIGACLGSEFAFFPDKDADIKGKPLENCKKLDNLPDHRSIIDHPFIKNLDAQIISMRKKRPESFVIPPFFWDSSGRATIHGIITTSLKLFGNDIFIRILEDPDFVVSLHSWITDTYITLIQHFSDTGNIPVSSVHIGECSGSMLGPEQYGRFIVLFVNKIGETLGPIRLHSCGFSDHIINSIAMIKNLKVIDTGSDTSLALIREQLGTNLEINVAPPVEILLEGSDQKRIISWLEKVLNENGDRPLKIAYHLEPGYSLENCLKIHDELYKRGLIEKGRKY